MAGKYHRTYLREQVQEAFEKMQKETGVASNAYISEAVIGRLEAEGYLVKAKPLNNLPAGMVGATNEISSKSPRSRRRRRA
jgi:hypothetical protein